MAGIRMQKLFTSSCPNLLRLLRSFTTISRAGMTMSQVKLRRDFRVDGVTFLCVVSLVWGLLGIASASAGPAISVTDRPENQKKDAEVS